MTPRETPRARARAPRPVEDVDVVVIGAGFGGLGAALTLAEEGARVVVCEALKYPGGCAGTFDHGGYRFEAGATLSSGFAPGQLFRRFVDRHGLDVELEPLDPVVELRTPSFCLPIPASRDALVDRLAQLPGAPVDELRAFFAHQLAVADVAWSMLDHPASLPPFGLAGAWHHLRNVASYGPVLRDLGRPLLSVVRRFGLEHWRPLRTYLDALCQITAQCSAAEAEAVFALGTLDYYFRGAAHIRGGIGHLAWELSRAIEQQGGEVRFTDRVKSLRHDRDGLLRVDTRRGELRARAVVANVLPQGLRQLYGEGSKRLAALERQVETGWGACMLYRAVVPPADAGPQARHFELVVDETQPLVEGNHVFCSIGSADEASRSPGGPGERPGAGNDVGDRATRSMTVSTHIDLRRLRALDDGAQAAHVAEVQERMRRAIAEQLGEWADVRFESTASPRTFERFTRREDGWVGGVPRRSGLRSYLGLWAPSPTPPGIHLVGDSVFPGQSTLATALGGVRAANRILGRLGTNGRSQKGLRARAEV